METDGETQSERTQDVNGYFNSYNDLSVHQLMLKDRPRTLAYRNFFEEHREDVKDKVVLDVGAGTGILSLFAAVAGAKKVYAVEASETAGLCKEIVEENGFDGTIEIIQGTVEDIELPSKVDVIVSEWMGFYLLHESMLDSVIVARDKFLAPDGIMAPSHATIRMAPVDMTDHFQERAEEWSNVYGFDFSPVASAMNQKEISQPLVQTLSTEVLRSESKQLLSLDLKSVTLNEVQKFKSKLEFHISQETKIHGFACWFDVEFHGSASEASKGVSNSVNVSSSKQLIDEKGDAGLTAAMSTSPLSPVSLNDHASSSSSVVALRTGPEDSPTHWKQTVIFLPQTIAVAAGTDLCCRVTMAQDTQNNKRHYNITVALTGDTDEEEEDTSDEGGEGGESDASTECPVPCQCGSERCRLIAALVEKYDMEHEELGDEAELVEVEAEVAAARQLDEAIESEGWPLDASTSATSMNDG